jgi:hypothetical protein
MVIHGLEGALAKESRASGVYEREITGLWSPCRNTGQGICFCGEDNPLNGASIAKAKVCSESVTLGMKVPEVTRTKPETT